jgi:hypothetical protein
MPYAPPVRYAATIPLGLAPVCAVLALSPVTEDMPSGRCARGSQRRTLNRLPLLGPGFNRQRMILQVRPLRFAPVLEPHSPPDRGRGNFSDNTHRRLSDPFLVSWRTGPGLWPELCIAPGLFCETMGGRKPELLRIERNSGSVGAQPGVIFRRGTSGCGLCSYPRFCERNLAALSCGPGPFGGGYAPSVWTSPVRVLGSSPDV